MSLSIKRAYGGKVELESGPGWSVWFWVARRDGKIIDGGSYPTRRGAWYAAVYALTNTK